MGEVTEDFTQDELEAGLRRLNEIAWQRLEELRAMAPKLLAERRAIRERFEARLTARWGASFDLLELLMALAFDAAAEFNQRHREQAAQEQDFVFTVLIRLHARASRTASEVMALLRSGHGDGAHARWRTLHELAVVAYFIREHGEEVARRYLEHEAIDTFNAMQEYQEHCTQLDYEPFTPEELEAARQEHERLVNQYGRPFARPYGWAYETIQALDPDFNGRLSFGVLEAYANLGHLRPYYRMASQNVHADPRAIRFSLGVLEPEKLLLAGPSEAGLADPGHGTAISLYQVTAALLLHKADDETRALVGALDHLLDEIGQAFLAAEPHRRRQEGIEQTWQVLLS